MVIKPIPKLSSFAAVIFDLDGLVLDTEATFHIAWQQAAQQMGYSFTDSFCRSLVGLAIEKIQTNILATYGVAFDLQQFLSLSDHYWYQHVRRQGIPIKPGFKPLMAAIIANNTPYALATNSYSDNAYDCLLYAGLHKTFEVIVSRDEVDYPKPAPDIFWAAANKLDVNIADCLVLEDSYTGILAAFRAGAYVVGVPSIWPAQDNLKPYCQWLAQDLSAVLQVFGVDSQ
jgi:beta-phosphoglucomutase